MDLELDCRPDPTLPSLLSSLAAGDAGGVKKGGLQRCTQGFKPILTYLCSYITTGKETINYLRVVWKGDGILILVSFK